MVCVLKPPFWKALGGLETMVAFICKMTAAALTRNENKVSSFLHNLPLEFIVSDWCTLFLDSSELALGVIDTPPGPVTLLIFVVIFGSSLWGWFCFNATENGSSTAWEQTEYSNFILFGWLIYLLSHLSWEMWQIAAASRRSWSIQTYPRKYSLISNQKYKWQNSGRHNRPISPIQLFLPLLKDNSHSPCQPLQDQSSLFMSLCFPAALELKTRGGVPCSGWGKGGPLLPPLWNITLFIFHAEYILEHCHLVCVTPQGC